MSNNDNDTVANGSLALTELWFRRAWADPAVKLQVQSGVHCEEVSEWLCSLTQVKASRPEDVDLLEDAQAIMHALGSALKEGHVEIAIQDRKECIDGLADQLVTATGVAVAASMRPTLALDRVNESNFSKFDSDGQPIFDANGKVAKGPNYRKPDLEGCY